ncbi:hypothetical protein BV898_04566 [Hypsibius exemplaris]|uniref:Receptor ligand binding region domain-containing protein n=1 Tax=Hypsibius exemplaris TaxID=2072580 RepID=A0A1W0X1I3_HYPEX|nr:hypothetical protein BV898_04566 [Hypsibius exemplaris]
MTSDVNATLLSECPANVSAAAGDGVLNVRVFSVVFLYKVLLGSLPYVGPAFDTAQEDIARLYPKLNLTMEFLRSYPDYQTCPEWTMESDNAIAAYYYDKMTTGNSDVTLFLLPGCNDVIGVAQFATQLDKLIISSVSSAGNIRDRDVWPTWITTTILSMSTYRYAYEKILDLYDWRDFVIVSDVRSNSFYPLFASYMYKFFSASAKYQVYNFEIDNTIMGGVEYANLLHNISTLSRGFLTFRDGDGDDYRWSPAEQGKEKLAKETFKSVLMVETEPYSASENNVEELVRFWKKQSRDVYNFTYPVNETQNPHVLSTYQAMLIMAEVLDDLHQSSEQNKWQSGVRLAKQFLNRTFALRTGNVTIGESGERIPTMVVTQTDVESNIVIRQDSRISPFLVASRGKKIIMEDK